MVLKDAYKYVQENIDESFPIQNITKNHSCKTMMKEVKGCIKRFGGQRECKVFYEYRNGITIFCEFSVLFEKFDDMDSEQEILDKKEYGFNYIETTLENALEIFKLQNEK